MPFSNVPKKNPGRYFEKLVNIVQPIGEGGQSGAAQFCNRGVPANKDWSQNMEFQKNPGRYMEKFVKIVQPIGEAGQTKAAATQDSGQDWSQTKASQTRSQKESTNTGFVMKN